MSFYQCPVCGYDKMSGAPQSWYICECCGVEFENDDDEVSNSELRRRWIANGAKWFSDADKPPKNWNAYQQLFDAGYGSEFIDMSSDDRNELVEIPNDTVWRFPDLLGSIRPA